VGINKEEVDKILDKITLVAGHQSTSELINIVEDLKSPKIHLNGKF
jgi:hypothetical protein